MAEKNDYLNHKSFGSCRVFFSLNIFIFLKNLLVTKNFKISDLITLKFNDFTLHPIHHWFFSHYEFCFHFSLVLLFLLIYHWLVVWKDNFLFLSNSEMQFNPTIQYFIVSLYPINNLQLFDFFSFNVLVVLIFDLQRDEMMVFQTLQFTIVFIWFPWEDLLWFFFELFYHKKNVIQNFQYPLYFILDFLSL